MDVSFLEPVFAATGPFATVCADVTHNTENADAEVELRVRAVAEKLAEQGAPEPVVDVIRERLLEANDGGEAGTLHGRALVVAADGSVALDQPLIDAPLREVAEWSEHPDLLPILRQLPGRVPHIVVLTDRVGADITYVSAPGQVIEAETVEGDSFQIRKFQAAAGPTTGTSTTPRTSGSTTPRTSRRRSPRWSGGSRRASCSSPVTCGPVRSSPTGRATCGRT